MQWPVAAEEWPIIGRDAELDRLGVILADPTAPGAVVMGGSGVGKTRLGDEMAGRSRDLVIYVPATQAAATVPLGAFAPFLPAEGLGEGDAYVRLRRAADAVVADVPEGGRALVYVDDAHLLDDASAALVMQLSVSGRVLLLLTVCAGEPQPDALVDLWKDSLVRLDLEPLSLTQVERLLTEVLGGVVDRRTAHESHRASGGNPLLLRELVVGMRQADRLVERSGVWRAVGPFGVPPRLAELVELRLGRLPPEARDLFDVVALGEPVALGMVDQLGLLPELEDLQRVGLLKVRRDDRRIEVRLAHPVHAEVSHQSLGEGRRIRLLGQLRDWTREQGARRRDDSRRLAIWSIETGAQADPAALLTAASDAWVGHDLEQTVRLARLAAASGASAGADHLHGLALDGLGRHEEAEAVFAAGDARAVTDEERLMIATARSDNLYRGLARAEEAARVADAAQAVAEDATAGGLLEAQLAVFALFDARLDDALAAAEPLLDLDDDVVVAVAGLSVAMSRNQRGHHERALQVATRALEARRRLDQHVQGVEEAVNANALVHALVGLGRLHEAQTVIEPVYRAAVRQGDRHGQAWSAHALALLHLEMGQWHDAERHARESAAVYADLAHPGVHASGSLRALASLVGGRVDDARVCLDELAARPEQSVPMIAPEVERALAWWAVARDEVPDAVARLSAVADDLRDDRRHGVEIVLRHDLVRLGATDHAHRLEELGGLVDGPFADARGALATGVLRGDALQLDAVAEEFAAMGALLFAAESANEASIAHRGAGSTRAATASRRRSTAWARECGEPRTPMLAHGTDTGLLTRREREIAALAAAGHPNREIAELLVVSPRTIENHLQRVYEKLGISRRSELGDALGNAGR